jgi:hypothetical protein
MSSSHNHPHAVYEVLVEGELDPSWQQWFNGLTVAFRSAGDGVPVTTLTARVVDQSALRGMLCKLWDLNLTLISVRRIEAGDEEGEK